MRKVKPLPTQDIDAGYGPGQITIIFGPLSDGSLLIYIFASNNCFCYRNIFQNGAGSLSKIDDAL